MPSGHLLLGPSFHLTLSRAHRAHFSNSKYAKKKRDILSEKRESGMVLNKVSLRPKAVMLTPMRSLVACDQYDE